VPSVAHAGELSKAMEHSLQQTSVIPSICAFRWVDSYTAPCRLPACSFRGGGSIATGDGSRHLLPLHFDVQCMHDICGAAAVLKLPIAKHADCLQLITKCQSSSKYHCQVEFVKRIRPLKLVLIPDNGINSRCIDVHLLPAVCLAM
jgi:hypothetical protein